MKINKEDLQKLETVKTHIYHGLSVNCEVKKKVLTYSDDLNTYNLVKEISETFVKIHAFLLELEQDADANNRMVTLDVEKEIKGGN